MSHGHDCCCNFCVQDRRPPAPYQPDELQEARKQIAALAAERYAAETKALAEYVIAENLRAERDQLRLALKAVEFMCEGTCPYCGMDRTQNHHEHDCIVGKALEGK